jgi:D-serine deaminase-like pyridoxal phosphate-dependent protein
MTCATLAEAEALVSNGITDILISRELAGDRIACTGFATGRSKKF